MMRPLRIAGVLCVLVCMTAGQARATVNHFEGAARIELHERLDYADPYALETTVVDLEIQLDGSELPFAGSEGAGSATVSKGDSLVTVQLIANTMSPPAGGGGRVVASGVGGDGNSYCFEIWDTADAPTPRPDRIIAAFGPPLSWLSVSPPEVRYPFTHCAGLLYREDWVIDGDFAFTTTI